MRLTKLLSFITVALLVAVVFTGLVTIPAAAQTDTMQFHYNAQHTGDYSPAAGPVPSNGQLKWSYTTGSNVSSSPAIVNGIVYVGSYDHNVYALYANNGTKLWNYTTGGIVSSSPAVANGIVYVKSDWPEYNLYALNATTGAFIWKFLTVNGDVSPTVVDDVIYAGYGSLFYAINATTGTQLWNTTKNSVYTTPAVANGVIYFGSDDHNVYALDANNGTQLWNHTGGSSNAYSSPAVSNGVVYIGSNLGPLYALNATTGADEWQFSGYYGQSSPAVANGVVYFGGGNQENKVYALNATDGAQLWNYTTGNLNQLRSSPAVVNGAVYVGSMDNNIYAIGNGQTILTISAPATAVVTKNFTINGTLSVGTAGIDSQNITMQRSTDNATWANVTTTKTGADGRYQFSKNESATGTYYYRTAYGGNDTYTNAKSNVVNVPVNKIPTQLSAAAKLTAVAISKNFTINGALNTSDGTPIKGATIQLQKNVSGTWTDVTGKTNTTTALGAYSIGTSEPTPGPYQYRTTYAGNASYTNATSSVVNVTCGAWSSWESLSGQLTASPAAVSSSNGRIDVFGRGSDNALWHKWYDSAGWWAWESLSGQLAPTTGPAVSAWSSTGRLDVFVIGSDQALWHRSYANNVWSTWESLGGQLTASPAAVSWAYGRIDVFGRGSDNALWQRSYQNGAWSDWEPLSGQLAPNDGPAVSSQREGQLHVFAVGSDNALWQRSYENGAWGAWESLSGQLTASPGAVSWADGRIDVFGRGSDNALWQRSYENGTWSDWVTLSGQLAATTGPAVSSQHEEQLDVFVIGSDNALWHRTYA